MIFRSAVTYRHVGRINDAIIIGGQVTATAEQILGHKHPDTLAARTNLANSYRHAGRTSEAITTLGQVVTDRTRIFGLEHPDA